MILSLRKALAVGLCAALLTPSPACAVAWTGTATRTGTPIRIETAGILPGSGLDSAPRLEWMPASPTASIFADGIVPALTPAASPGAAPSAKTAAPLPSPATGLPANRLRESLTAANVVAAADNPVAQGNALHRVFENAAGLAEETIPVSGKSSARWTPTLRAPAAAVLGANGAPTVKSLTPHPSQPGPFGSWRRWLLPPVLIALMLIGAACQATAPQRLESFSPAPTISRPVVVQPRTFTKDPAIAQPQTGATTQTSVGPTEAAAPAQHDQIRTQLARLSRGIVWEGGSAQSRAEAFRIISAMLEQAPEAIVKGIADTPITIIQVPPGHKILEYPEARHVSENTVGLTILYGNHTVKVFVPEEDLLSHYHDDSPRHVMIHEWAHVVLFVGYPHWQGGAENEITTLFAETGMGGSFTDDYASSNAHEYFAQASAAWFGEHDGTVFQGGWHVRRNADWLKKHQPALYRTLLKLYGPPRRIGPAPEFLFQPTLLLLLLTIGGVVIIIVAKRALKKRKPNR